jgi:hypothetical protein
LSYGAFESALRLPGRKVGATVRASVSSHSRAGRAGDHRSLKVTQELLGHAHLSTTADLYITVDPSVLVDAVAAVKAHAETAQFGSRSIQ